MDGIPKDDLETHAKVLDLTKQRKKREQNTDQCNDYYAYIDECKKVGTQMNDLLYDLLLLKVDDDVLHKFKELIDQDMIRDYREAIKVGIPKLLKLQKFFKEVNNKWA